NHVLYDLCKAHPFHTDDDAIVAKFLLIGRSYSAAAERRKKEGGPNQNDSADETRFYEDEFRMETLTRLHQPPPRWSCSPAAARRQTRNVRFSMRRPGKIVTRAVSMPPQY